MIKGIVFDFDGIILDTETPIYQSWQDIYRENGFEFPFDQWSTTIGTADFAFDPYENLVKLTRNAIDSEQIRTKQAQLEYDYIIQKQPMPGVVDYLVSARDMGIQVGIASSSPFAWVDGHLTRLGLRQYFECIVTKEEVSLTKPYPFLYQKAVTKLNLYPYQVIAIEDAPFGVTAAQAAGIFAIAVPNELTKRMNLSHADLIIPSLAEISLANLLEKIGMN